MEATQAPTTDERLRERLAEINGVVAELNQELHALATETASVERVRASALRQAREIADQRNRLRIEAERYAPPKGGQRPAW